MNPKGRWRDKATFMTRARFLFRSFLAEAASAFSAVLRPFRAPGGLSGVDGAVGDPRASTSLPARAATATSLSNVFGVGFSTDSFTPRRGYEPSHPAREICAGSAGSDGSAWASDSKEPAGIRHGEGATNNYDRENMPLSEAQQAAGKKGAKAQAEPHLQADSQMLPRMREPRTAYWKDAGIHPRMPLAQNGRSALEAYLRAMCAFAGSQAGFARAHPWMDCGRNSLRVSRAHPLSAPQMKGH